MTPAHANASAGTAPAMQDDGDDEDDDDGPPPEPKLEQIPIVPLEPQSLAT